MHNPMRDYFFPFNPGLKLKSGIFLGNNYGMKYHLMKQARKIRNAGFFFKKEYFTIDKGFLMVNPA
jgi:hypothetical protein